VIDTMRRCERTLGLASRQPYRSGLAVATIFALFLLTQLPAAAHTLDITSVSVSPSPRAITLDSEGGATFDITVHYTASGFGPTDCAWLVAEFCTTGGTCGRFNDSIPMGGLVGPSGSGSYSRSCHLGGPELLGYSGGAKIIVTSNYDAAIPMPIFEDTYTVSGYTIGGNCTYSISPASKSFSASGGDQVVNVTTQSSCAWSASSPCGWATVTPTSGTGSGTVTVSAEANSGSARSCTVTIAGKTFTVNQQTGVGCSYSLTTAVSPSGKGTVSKSPSKSVYCSGDSVALTANPSSGWTFDHWEGDLSGSAKSQSLVMNGNKSVTAHFTQPCSYSLTTAVSPSGKGTVSKSPSKSVYCSDDSVTLTANPSSGWTFDHWEGDLSGSAKSQSLSMNGDKSVIAYFTQTPPPCSHSLTVMAFPEGSGCSVSRSPSKFSYGCSDTVVLTAQPAAGWRLDRWVGAISGTTLQQTLIMTKDQSVTAYFIPVANSVQTTQCVLQDKCRDEGDPHSSCICSPTYCAINAVAFSGLASFLLDFADGFYNAEKGVWEATHGVCDKYASWAGPLCDLFAGGSSAAAVPLAYGTAYFSALVGIAEGFIGLDAISTWGTALTGEWVAPATGQYRVLYVFEITGDVDYVFANVLWFLLDGVLQAQAAATFRLLHQDVVMHTHTESPLDSFLAGIMWSSPHDPITGYLGGRTATFLAQQGDTYTFDFTLSVTYRTEPGLATEMLQTILKEGSEIVSSVLKVLPEGSTGITTNMTGTLKGIVFERVQ